MLVLIFLIILFLGVTKGTNRSRWDSLIPIVRGHWEANALFKGRETLQLMLLQTDACWTFTDDYYVDALYIMLAVVVFDVFEKHLSGKWKKK